MEDTMKKITLNHDWMYTQGTVSMMEMFTGGGSKIKAIDLPHDAMICRERTQDTANVHQTGFYPGGEYTYMKKWLVPKEWEGQTVCLEFEGVADTCRIYINGDFVTEHYNPYTGIFVDASTYLKYGEENEIKVEVRSVEQSSRWYSGAGIYRPVHAWVGGVVHIPARGLHIDTQELCGDTASVELRIPIKNCGQISCRAKVCAELLDADGNTAAKDSEIVTLSGQNTQLHRQRLTVSAPHLWSDEDPYLYTYKVQIVSGEDVLDSTEGTIGIRRLCLNAAQGLTINGKETKLRGTCIHHDNGLIGSATFADAEYRRCRQLKEAGFNAIRSAHHPMSKAMLDACDRLGMLVMDELSDMWTRTKNPHDYANYFPYFWEQDIEDMVEKDYNHPSVILYSTGNEIPEAGTARGAEWNRRLNTKIKKLDTTRFTTNGINGLIASTERMGEIICEATGLTPEQLEAMMQPGAGTDGEAGQAGADNQSAQADNGSGQAGADAINDMASFMVGETADAVATSKILEEILTEFAGVTDIAGYNYLTALHEEEHKRHPNRIVLGTETFPADIVNLWDIVKRNHHVIGDFTWTGYDYLGEAGCGIFHYDGAENFSTHWPDRLAGIGDIDILGDRKPISYLREAVFGIGTAPSIGVQRMDCMGLHVNKTPWMWKDNIASWTWPGYEGRGASIDVHANADEVELFLNGQSMGRQSVRDTYLATYEVPYEPGTLEAVSFVNGVEAGRCALETADQAAQLVVESSTSQLPADGDSLAFVTVRLADQAGRMNRRQKEAITINVEGPIVLQGYGSANPSCLGSYQDTTWDTFDGAVMAVIRAGKEAGTGRITFSSGEMETVEIEIEVLG